MSPSQPNMDQEKEHRDMQYVVITPARNEAAYIERTIRSMIEQTVRPVEWIIVNDGSTDATSDIVTRYTKEHPWIKLVRRDDRGTRQRGKGVVETFYAGFEKLTQNYDFIVKLDADLSFAPCYFESLGEEFDRNPQLGIAGGGVYERLDGENWLLRAVQDHVRGPTKVYRRTCFEAIGGLVPALGWDGIDEWKALTLGWEVRSFLELKVYHYRVTGAATGSVKSRAEEGYGAYYMGYHPLFLVARGVRRVFSRPYFSGGIAMIVAYFWAWIQGREQLPDPAVIRFIRRTQLKKLANWLRKGEPIHEI
jgi:biofilm PGA synthesis N-glycosyltransferase PgaC